MMGLFGGNSPNMFGAQPNQQWASMFGGQPNQQATALFGAKPGGMWASMFGGQQPMFPGFRGIPLQRSPFQLPMFQFPFR